MKIKAKHVMLLGAFIVLTLLGYRFLPRDEILIQTNSEEDFSESENSPNQERIFVHIEGAVSFPGIKEVAKGTRLFELIEVAGGTTMDADTSKVNLASILKDEQKIYIPFQVKQEIIESEKTDSIKDSSVGNNSVEDSSAEDNPAEDDSQKDNSMQANSALLEYIYQEGMLVNINSASIEELQTLEGIGPSMAKKIITYREEVGYFNSIEEIKNVSGIGEAKYNKIKENITV